jgi:Arc/MetJ-type ribon-helix-helix transcriptional regulator
MKRDKNSKIINLHVPDPMVEAIKVAVKKLDTDRSKFIRAAIREKMGRHGFAIDSQD